MGAWRYGIWFVGAGVWLLVAALSLRSHEPSRTLGAIAVAAVLFVGGMFFAKNPSQLRRRK